MSIWERRLERSGKSASAASSEVINKKKKFESEREITAYFIRINKMDVYDLY